MRDVHQPIRMIVLLVAPLSFIAIAPPAWRLWEDTLSSVYPFAMSQLYVAPHRTAIVTSLSKTLVVRVGGWQTVLIGVEVLIPQRFTIWRANAATGQMSLPVA